MRHGESANNILAKISKEEYKSKRVAEPELSPQGVKECEQVGEWLRTTGVQIDSALTSAHKRAILSTKHALIGYQKQVPTQLMLNIHERGGVH